MERPAKRADRRRKGSYTELKAKDFTQMIADELGDEIDAGLNGFVRAVVNDLSTNSSKRSGVSPVLTGFFASSWKASTKQVTREKGDRKAPWSNIKLKHSLGKTVLAPGQKPIIKQRWVVPTNFTRKKPVYIGNTAPYAPYALFSPKSNITAYLQGGASISHMGGAGDPSGGFSWSLTEKINRFFSDKRPDLRVGSSIVGDPADIYDVTKPSVRYSKQ